MNQFLLIVFVLVVCGGAYMRSQQPEDWNHFLDSLKAPGNSTNPSAPGSADNPGGNPESVVVQPKPTHPEYINPTPGTVVHSSHIVDVAQPTPADHPSVKVFVAPNPLPSQPAWVWTTSDGRTFKNVIIEKVEADRVTIFHDQGSAVIDILTLPDSIKSQLNYDPDLASQASAARAAAPAPANP